MILDNLDEIKDKISKLEQYTGRKATPELIAQYFDSETANIFFNIEPPNNSNVKIPLGADYDNIEPKQYDDEISTDATVEPRVLTKYFGRAVLNWINRFSNGDESVLNLLTSELQSRLNLSADISVIKSILQSATPLDDLIKFLESNNVIIDADAFKVEEPKPVNPQPAKEKTNLNSSNEELKLRLKCLTANQLASIGVAQLVEGKDDEIICPFCGNGSGRSRTGISPSYFPNGAQYHCFKCGESFDNLNLFALYFNLDINNDFQEVLKRAAELSEGVHSVEPQKIKQNEELTDEQKAKTAADISEYAKAIENYPEEDRRSLKVDTLKHFNCGFTIDWLSPKIPSYYLPPTPRLIIPNGAYSYNAILPLRLRPNINKEYWKLNVNPKRIFNFDNAFSSDKPIIIVEGEIDAMSIWQATCGNIEPLALLGTGFKKLIARLDEKFPDKSERLKLSFVVLLDNDDAGISTSKKLTAALVKHGYPAAADFLIVSTDKIDANDILCKQGDDALKSRVEQIIANATPKLDDIRKEINAEIKTEYLIQQPSARRQSTKEIMPDCPVDLFLPAGYGFSSHGISFEGDIVCHTPVVITKVLCDVDNVLKKYTEISFFNRFTKKWCFTHFSDTVLSDYRLINCLMNYHIDFNYEKGAKKLSFYFSELPFVSDNLNRIPYNLLFHRTGWVDDSFAKFILPDHLEDGDILDDPTNIYSQKFNTKGDRNKWGNSIKKLFLNRDISPAFKTIFGATLAAPLYRSLGLRNSQYLLWCASGNGKSAVAKISMSIYGNPIELKNTFSGTANSLAELAKFFPDLAVWIDEFQSSSKNIREEIASFVYGFAEGKSRGRQNRAGVNKPTTNFYGVRIFTGEQPIVPPSSDAGAFNRLLQISTDNLLPADCNIANVHRFFENNYGFLGWDWIKFIIANLDDIRTQYRINQKFFTSVAKKNNWSDGWINDFAVILTSWQFAMKLIDNESILTFDDIRLFFMNNFEIINKDIPRKDNIKNHVRALGLLEEYIISHPRLFKNEKMVNGYYAMCNNSDGYPLVTQGYQFRDGSFGFIPSQLDNILQNELNFSSAEAVKRGWLDDGLLESPNNNHKYARRKKIVDDGSVKNPMLIIFKPKVFNIISPVEENE